MAELRIGTSAFTAAGWQDSFYPKGMKPADYLTYYATKFSTVEIDSTFYRTPSRKVVQGWADKTPTGFLIAAKVPQEITHEKCLQDCDKDFGEYIASRQTHATGVHVQGLSAGRFREAPENSPCRFANARFPNCPRTENTGIDCQSRRRT